MPSLAITRAYKEGNNVSSPSPIMIPPEMYVNVCGGTSIKKVVAFRAKVNTSREIARDTAIMRGRFLSFVSPLTEPPMIIGSKASTHGARTVSIPAINDPISNNMKSPYDNYGASRTITVRLALER